MRLKNLLKRKMLNILIKIIDLMQIKKRKIHSTVLNYIGFKDLKFLLATLHRGHSTSNPLANQL
jgi:hypothetical protein